MSEEEVWTGRVSQVDEYEPFDAIVAGDTVRLGRNPRKVVEVRRSPNDDALRVILVNRLSPGRLNNGTIVNGPTITLFRADLTHNPVYRFGGFVKEANP